MVAGTSALMSMNAGTLTLIAIGAIAVGLILFEWWQKRRARRRQERRVAQRRAGTGPDKDRPRARPEGEGDSEGAAAGAAAGGFSLWRWLFGPAPGEDTPYDLMQDIHPDELEGQYDGDPPPRGGAG